MSGLLPQGVEFRAAYSNESAFTPLDVFINETSVCNNCYYRFCTLVAICHPFPFRERQLCTGCFYHYLSTVSTCGCIPDFHFVSPFASPLCRSRAERAARERMEYVNHVKMTEN